MVTHDLPYAYELCPRSVVLSDGVVVADGSTRDVLTDDDLMTAHRLELPFGFDPGPSPRPRGAPPTPALVRAPSDATQANSRGASSRVNAGRDWTTRPYAVSEPTTHGLQIVDRHRRTVEGVGLQQPVRRAGQVRRHPPGAALLGRRRSAESTPAASR